MNIQTYITGIQHIGIPTGRMEETLAFYQKLGFEIVHTAMDGENRVYFLKLNDIIIETYDSANAPMCYGGIEHLALNVSDISAVFQEICALCLNTLNDEIHFLPFWENGVKYFTIEGPNKEKVEFSQYL